MFGANKRLKQSIEELKNHLRNENPILEQVVAEFSRLDQVAHKMGLLDNDESYTSQVSWWPLISILGTFSAGKSSFINSYLKSELQATGTQAVDDKFTVVCYASSGQTKTLPGVSLDADPRFPFYQMSEAIEKIAPGKGELVDSYLQMKTSDSEKLRGRIFIDSPGFDADEQRSETLRLTDHIINLSDLVLVFFDARHPEPGAMRDTLKHLVTDRIYQSNSEKFVYILNQIDVTAREDNPEEVVAAWQRCLAGEGMKSGKFYTIYNPDVAPVIEDDVLRKRYEEKRDADLDELQQRIEQVGVERVYRVVASLEKTAKKIENEYLPELKHLLVQWRKGVIWRDIIFGIVALGVAGLLLHGYMMFTGEAGFADWKANLTSMMQFVCSSPLSIVSSLAVLISAGWWTQMFSRRLSANSVLTKLNRSSLSTQLKTSLAAAFTKNTSFWHSIFRPEPVGYGKRSHNKIRDVIAGADSLVKRLNDQFARPSGDDVLSADRPPAISAREDTDVANTESEVTDDEKKMSSDDAVEASSTTDSKQN